jgi:transposase
MRQEILGVERRRRWSDEGKLPIIGEVGVGGQRVADVARRHDLTRQHLYQWRLELRQKGLMQADQAILVPVEVGPDAVPAAGAKADHPHHARVEIVLGNGRIVRLGSDVPDETIIRLIRIVEAA